MFKYHKLFLTILILVIFIIPSSYAITNETDDFKTNLEVSNEDILAANNDYFFNSSLEYDDGDGSLQNPYKYLTTDRIKSNSNIYLADGEYELDNSKTIETVNIIGSGREKTIIKYDGVGFNVNSKLTLTNLTLMDMSITNYGTVEADNVIFDHGWGTQADKYGNSYGGAIYTTDYNSNPKVTILNSVFKDNFALYGGAIYMGAGELTVSNSQFINNRAYNFGGAIACQNTANILISKSGFVNNTAIEDAGGALYVKSSILNIERCDFINSSATFGGAITTLNCDLTLNFINAVNNSATWDGGAVYHMYGKFINQYGKFNNNSARNGGALYIDNSTYVYLLANTFENNNASLQGGAIFSLLNNIPYSFTSNDYKNNHAPLNNDYYDTKNLNVFIGSNNYTIYNLQEDNEIISIPNYYSLVDDGFVTPVKDQQSSGNCWAFTAIAVLESCLKKATGQEFDLSEENMKNLIALYSDYGWQMDTNEGGYDSMPFGYFASWLGPVDEKSDVFDDNSVLSPVLNSILHIQNILFLKRDNYTDNDDIKRAILKYGGVGTSIYFDDYYLNGISYYTWNSYINHAVTIVGWDDNYSRDNFKFGAYAGGDGAWIVKNSWGPNWGDNGYFYVSYYDESFARVGAEGSAYTFILNDTVKYDKNYQYDIAGKTDYLHDDRTEVWYKNKFTATDNEILAAVSTYFEKLTNWTVSVYVNDVLKTVKSGISEAGYYTIHLDDIISLYEGDVFEIVFNTTTKDLSAVPISEIASLNKAIYYPEISYVSYDGVNWQDLFYLTKSYALHKYYSQVACIKAFTILKDYNTTVSINIKGNNFIIQIIDENGNNVKNGEININFNNLSQIINLKDSLTEIPFNLDEGVYNVSVNYTGEGYNSSNNNLTFNINLIIDLPSNNIYTLNSGYKITLHDQYGNKLTNKKISININNNIFEKTSDNNGEIKFNINLNVGKYNIKVMNQNLTLSQNIQVTPRLTGSNIIMFYGANKYYKVRIYDDNGKILPSQFVKIIINGKVYSSKSDRNGFASVKLNKLAAKTYTVTVEYKGFKLSNKIKVKPILTAKNIHVKKGKTFKFKAKLVNSKGKPVKGKKIIFKIKGKKYAAKTNRKGVASVKIKKLNKGSYKIQSCYGNVKIYNKIIVKK